MNYFTMAGTEMTYEYLVIVRTRRGRLGVRPLYGGTFRVRVEPAKVGNNLIKTPFTELSRENGWKQPGDNNQTRYSIVVSDLEELREVLWAAIQALTDDVAFVQSNPDESAAQEAMEWVLSNGEKPTPELFTENTSFSQGFAPDPYAVL